MTIPLGIEAFQRALPAVHARVLSVACRATPVRGRMLDRSLGDNRAGRLRIHAGGLITTPSSVVAQFGGMVSAVSSTIPLPGSGVSSIGSFVTPISRAIPATTRTRARSVVAFGVVCTHHDALPRTQPQYLAS